MLTAEDGEDDEIEALDGGADDFLPKRGSADIALTVEEFAASATGNLVEVHVSALRRKIDLPFGVETVRTVRGAGYHVVAAGAGFRRARHPVRSGRTGVKKGSGLLPCATGTRSGKCGQARTVSSGVCGRSWATATGPFVRAPACVLRPFASAASACRAAFQPCSANWTA